MAKLKNKGMPKVGVDEFWFAMLEGDPADGSPLYGASVKVPGTVSVAFNSNAQNASFYADNGVYATEAQTGDLTLTVGSADITPEVRALWFGQNYKDALLEEGQISPPEMAVAFRIKKAGGAYRYIWLYKGKASPPSETTNTQGSSVSFQSDSITISCAALASTGKFRRVLDDDDENLPAALTPAVIAEKWFEDPLWDLSVT